MNFFDDDDDDKPTTCDLTCDTCGGEDFDGPDNGFFYCLACGAQSQNTQHTQYDEVDIHGEAGEGALYSLHRRRKTIPKPEPTQTGRWVDDEPRDFGACTDAGRLADGIRKRYVEGLQVMLQRQCEVMVERFGASPLVCGIAGTVWLRYVAVMKVFDEGWADRVIAESEAAVGRLGDGELEARKLNKKIKAKYRWEPHNRYNQRAIFIWFYSLKKTIPLHSTLAILFLACHLARDSILPTDIFDWVLDGKLPYLAAFTDMDRDLGSPSNACPLSSRFMFRPVRVIGAWTLEATAGSIAQTIGLRLPSVNFHGIASRYLRELSLPVEKLLPHACRLYEWSMPADLWLSSNVYRLPTRICVMAILIVTVRILYNIHGQGLWEKSLSGSSDSSKGEKRYDGVKVDSTTTDPMPAKNFSSPIQNTNFNTAEMLQSLEAVYDKISNTHDHSKDLRSYLEYCKDVVFAGRPAPFEEEKLMERLWKIYEEQEDNNKKEDILHSNTRQKRPRNESPSSSSLGSEEPRGENLDSSHRDKRVKINKDVAFGNMIHDMEENGFEYLPPRFKQRRDGYLYYKRRRADGKLNYVAHLDYYILLRACARLARVDARIMHLGVVKLERRLEWTEQQIDSSLG